LQLPRVVELGVEPAAVFLLRQDDRHPVVQGTQQVVGIRRDDYARFDGRGISPFPVLPETGKRERAFLTATLSLSDRLRFLAIGFGRSISCAG
jgi:hypothetical protein